MMATSHKRFQWIVLLMFWFCFVHEASNALFTCILLLLGKCSHRCFTCNCRSILSPIIYILLLQELKFFAILLHLKKKKKTEWVPTAEVSTERMHSIEDGKGLFSRGRMKCEWEEERFLTLMLLQESIQIKVDATAGAGRMLDFCRRKEDQVRTVLSRMCFIFLVFPCIMILQHQQLLLLSHSTDLAANCLSRRRWEKSLEGISTDALSSLKTDRLFLLCVCTLTVNPKP